MVFAFGQRLQNRSASPAYASSAAAAPEQYPKYRGEKMTANGSVQKKNHITSSRGNGMRTYGILSKSAVCLAVVLVAACASKPKPPAVMATAAPVERAAPPPAPPPQRFAQATAALPRRPDIIPGSLKDFQVNVGDTVYFSFDSSNLDDTSRGVLQKQAAWLNRYRGVTVQLQGNADERGTREYNLALGARRAASAREYLVSLGIAPARVDTISYGKERPVCAESTESCWAQNRRSVSTISGETAPNVAMR
jgi:peptidoglycan-associated lipoprotein